jgi:hypothetical protein
MFEQYLKFWDIIKKKLNDTWSGLAQGALCGGEIVTVGLMLLRKPWWLLSSSYSLSLVERQFLRLYVHRREYYGGGVSAAL